MKPYAGESDAAWLSRDRPVVEKNRPVTVSCIFQSASCFHAEAPFRWNG